MKMKNEGKARALRAATAISALMFVIPGLMLIVTPRLFYDVLADFPPYNQHFMGDAGAFGFGLGIGLLFAQRNPAQHWSIVAAALTAASVHVINHAYSDFVAGHETARHAVTNTLSLALVAVLLGWVLLTIRRNASH